MKPGRGGVSLQIDGTRRVEFQTSQTVTPYGRPPTLLVAARTPIPVLDPTNPLGLQVLDLGNDAGVSVTQVQPGSPATRLAIPFIPGDTIVSLDAKPIRHAEDFQAALKTAGRNVRLQGIGGADGQVYDVTLDCGRPIETSMVMNSDRFGAIVRAEVDGVRVVSTRPRSFAAAYEFTGDLINEINGRPIGGVEDFRDAIAESPDDVTISGLQAETNQPFRFSYVFSLVKSFRFGADLADDEQGLRIARIYPTFPASNHHLTAGDVITAIDSMPIRDKDEARRRIALSGTHVFQVRKAGQGEAESHSIDLAR